MAELTVFFGGSFDPPHSGHLGVARGALASGAAARVLWVPAFSPPHKAGRRRAPFADRLEMVKLLIADEPGMAVSDVEMARHLVPGYTIDVLSVLNVPGNPPVEGLLIGADSLLELHLWHRSRELAERYRVLTYPRPGYAVTGEALRAHWPPELAEKLLSGVLDGGFFEISSTEIRNSMAKDSEWRHINKKSLPPEVARYAAAHGLYGGDDGGGGT